MVTYPDPNLEDDIFDVGTESSGTDIVNPQNTDFVNVETASGVNRMPTNLPGSIFTNLPDPGPAPELNLMQFLLNREEFANLVTPKAKTKEELDAMFPTPSYKSDKYLALAKAGLALMRPTVGGRIAPAIAGAGTQLLNEVGKIAQVERAAKAKAQAGKINFKQQEEARRLAAIAQAIGINQNLLQQQEIKTFENRVKNHALKQEAYNKMVNTNAKAAMEFGIDKYKSDPVQIRFLDKNGVRVERAGFRMNNQYYVPTQQKDIATGDFIYELVPDATTVEIISTKTQNVDDVTKNMTQYNELFADYNNIAKNIYSLRQIMKSVDPELGGDPTRVAITGYIRRQVQKYGQIASDFTKDFFTDEYTDTITGSNKGGRGKTVWLTDLSDIIAMSDDASISPEARENFKMINNLLDSIEADGLGLIDRAKVEDLSLHFEGDTEAERQRNKDLIFNRLQFDRKIPENEARAQAIIYALARARKSSGRLNLDDIERAAETLNIYNDSSQAILTKLKVVQDELLAAHQTQADLLKRNFPKDAASLAQDRGGSLSYVVDGEFVGDNYYNQLFGYSVTPEPITYDVIMNQDGTYSFQAVE